MRVGDRVTVEIPSIKLREWSSDAAKALQGKTGKITRTTTAYPSIGYGPCTGTNPRDDKGALRILVEFDTPVGTWWRGQSAPLAWWFDRDELLEHGDDEDRGYEPVK